MSGLAPVAGIEPVGPPASLLTAARDRTQDGFGAPGGRWQTGISWRPRSCRPSSIAPWCDDSGWDTAPADVTGPLGTEPVTVYTPLDCDQAREEAALIAADAGRLTDVHTARALSRVLWLGEGLADFVTVNGGDVRAPTLRRCAERIPQPGDAAEALDDVVSELTHLYLECTGGSGGGVLHVPDALVLSGMGGVPGGGRVFQREGNRIVTLDGNFSVSPGPGYPHGASTAGADGFGPRTDANTPEQYQGNAANEFWIYVTGPVEYAADPVTVVPSDEAEQRGFHRMNTFEVWGRRLALVRFDCCCVFAGLVVSDIGGIS